MERTLIEMRRADPDGVVELLRQQLAEWSARLDWDRSGFLPRIEPLVRQRALPGWLLTVDGLAAGLVFLGEQDRALTLELAWTRPENRDDGSLSWLLAAAAERAITACPDRRMEIGLFSFGAPDPAAELGPLGFGGIRRDYMVAASGAAGAPASGLSAWPADPAPPARLLRHAYLGTPDAEAGSFYRTMAGCRDYLEALVRGGECGRFAPELSWVIAGPGSGLVGMVLGTVLSTGVAHLAQIAVHPGRRGGGLGRRLLDHFRHGAARLGVQRLTLLATRGNRPAYDWYRRLGFKRVEPFHSYWREPGPAR